MDKTNLPPLPEPESDVLIAGIHDARRAPALEDYYTAEHMHEYAARAVREAVPGWKPIETAPKDGTLYLCWVDAIRYGERDDGQVDQVDVSEVDFGQWQDFEHGGAHVNMMGDIGDGQQITHWRPLPAAPTQDQENGS